MDKYGINVQRYCANKDTNHKIVTPGWNTGDDRNCLIDEPLEKFFAKQWWLSTNIQIFIPCFEYRKKIPHKGPHVHAGSQWNGIDQSLPLFIHKIADKKSVALFNLQITEEYKLLNNTIPKKHWVVLTSNIVFQLNYSQCDPAWCHKHQIEVMHPTSLSIKKEKEVIR